MILCRLASSRLSFALLVAALPGCVPFHETKSAKHPAGLELNQRQGRHSDAVSSYERKRTDAQYQAALSRWKQGDPDSSQDLLKKLLARQPEHLAGLLLMSEIQLVQGTVETALDHAKVAIARYPDDAGANHQMGLVLDALGKTSEATNHYRRACELDPENRVYRIDLQAAESGRFDESPAQDIATERPPSNEKVAGSSTHKNPTPTPIVHVKVPGHRELPGDLADHAADMKAARLAGGRRPAAKPATQVSYPVEPAALRDDRSSGTEVGELRALMAANPGDSQIPVSAAMLALRQEQPVLAAELAQAGLREYSDCAGLYRVLGTAFYRLGEFSRAETALRKAISLDNTNASTYFLLGCTLDKLEQSAAAHPFYEQARKLDPKYVASAPRS